MTIRDQMLEHAYALTRRGIRPTADALVAELGGSKATAVQALQVFWNDYLPPRLADSEATTDDAPPETIGALVKELWSKAISYAEQQHAAKVEADQAALNAERDRLNAEREALAEEHALLSETAERATARTTAAEQQRDEADSQRRQTAAANATLEDRLEAATATIERSGREIERLNAALTALQDERAALVAQHSAAFDGLRAAHAQAIEEMREHQDKTETHLRVEVDAARTELKQARQDAIKAREGWDGKLEAERLRGERTLAAERDQAAARLAEVRADLEGQLVLMKQLLEQARNEAAKHAEQAKSKQQEE